MLGQCVPLESGQAWVRLWFPLVAPDFLDGCVHCGAEILSLPCFGKFFQRLRVERAPADTETASQLLGCFEVSALFLLLWGVSNWGQCVFGP